LFDIEGRPVGFELQMKRVSMISPIIEEVGANQICRSGREPIYLGCRLTNGRKSDGGTEKKQGNEIQKSLDTHRP